MSEEPRFLLAQSYLLRQDFTHAAAVLQDARKVFDKSPQLELALGVTYYGQRISRLLSPIPPHHRTRPEVPQAYVFLGRILEHACARLPEITERSRGSKASIPQATWVTHSTPKRSCSPYLPRAFHLKRNSLSNCSKRRWPFAKIGGSPLPDGHATGAEAGIRGGVHQLERSIQLNANDSAVHFRLARV